MGNDPGTELWIFYEGRSGNPDDDKIGSFKLSYPQDFEHLTTVAHLLDFVRKRLDLPPPSDLDLEIYDSLYSPHSICPASRVDSVIEASTVAFKCFWYEMFCHGDPGQVFSCFYLNFLKDSIGSTATAITISTRVSSTVCKTNGARTC